MSPRGPDLRASPGPGRGRKAPRSPTSNNDGKPDLYVCRFNAPNLLFINQGNGTFKEEAAARGLAVVDACVMGAFCDYDRDGWLDLYVATNMLDSAKHPDGSGVIFSTTTATAPSPT